MARKMFAGLILASALVLAISLPRAGRQHTQKNPAATKSIQTSSVVHQAVPSASDKKSASIDENKVASLKSGPVLNIRNRFGLKRQGEYGLLSRSEASEKDEAAENPNAAEEDAYAARAYPAAYIPQQLTVNAQREWTKVKARGVGKGKNTPGNWTLAGPSSSNFPAVLTFSGAAYTTSGRITALAIAPNCSNNGCRLWVAAAGGGIWRTDNALSGGGANWTFVSGSFSTNAIGTLTYDSATNTLYAGTGEPNASADSEAGFGI